MPRRRRRASGDGRTIVPRVGASLRAGMHTDTVRPVSPWPRSGPEGKSPCGRLADAPRLRVKQASRPGSVEAGRGRRRAPMDGPSSRATEGRARRRRGNQCGSTRCQCPSDEEDRMVISSLGCAVVSVGAPTRPRHCTCVTSASGRSRSPTTTSGSPPPSAASASRPAPAPSGATRTCCPWTTTTPGRPRRGLHARSSGPTAWPPSSAWASCGSRTTPPTRPARSRTGSSRWP